MHKGFLIWLFIFYALCAKAQPIDSLRKLVFTRADTSGVLASFELNKIFANKLKRFDSVIYYANYSLELSQKIQYPFGIIKSKVWLGNAYFVKNEFSKAIVYYQEAIRSAHYFKNGPQIADINNRLGAAYNNSNKFDSAVYCLTQAAKQYEKLGEKSGLAQAYYAISLAYKQLKQPNKRLEYMSKAIAIIYQLPQSAHLIKANILTSGAVCYIETHPTEKAYLDSGFLFAKDGMYLANLYNLDDLKPSLNIALSGYYYAKKNYTQSIQYAQKGLQYGKSVTERDRFNSYYRLAEGYREEKELKLAYAYIDSAKMLEIAKDPVFAANIAKSAYRLNKMTGESEKALVAFETYSRMRDSVVDMEKIKALNDLEVKYQSEIKDEKIATLAKEKELDLLYIRFLAIVLLSIVLLALVLFFIYRQISIKQKLALVETENRLNRARMNPHFFFNALMALQGMVLTQKDVAKTASVISQTARLMRKNLEATFSEFVTIEEDVAFLKEYMDVMLFKDTDLFTYHFSIDEELEGAEVPVMLVQPFVENAIEHGFRNINYPGKIDITYQLKQQNIVISITDNGVGITDNHSSNHTSRALQIINDRLILLGNKKAGYHIKPLQKGSGTIVEITIPIK